MQIIIAPAKKMVVSPDDFGDLTTPQYLAAANEILIKLRKFSLNELKILWKCSDKLAQQNYQILQNTNLNRQLTPAILAFSGIQYQAMAPHVFTESALAYVQTHLRILSGFYGILRPFDGIVPYRLEMQAALSLAGQPNLYAFWGPRLYQALTAQPGPIINLASQEYAKAIQPYLKPSDNMITIVFAQQIAGQLKTRATLAKIARGEMVRFMAEENIQDVNALKQFQQERYQFQPELSTQQRFVFVQPH